FYGTVEQAGTQSGCEKFEDAYLKLSGEEDAA
ncbi:ABC transporter ATP-binding protein, partial [Klebsiella oxytoca]